MMKHLISLLVCASLILASCSIHKIDIQQGNIITPDMIEKLEPGMTREQVRFIMGTPMVMDSFHQNRWDYVYTFKPGTKGIDPERYHVVLSFENDLLSNIQEVGVTKQ